MTFAKVLTSPLQHAMRTCELQDLAPWPISTAISSNGRRSDEGRRTAEIHAERPDWQLFLDGCPGTLGARADRVVGRVRAIKGDVLVCSSRHFLRIPAACWLGLDAAGGRYSC